MSTGLVTTSCRLFTGLVVYFTKCTATLGFASGTKLHRCSTFKNQTINLILVEIWPLVEVSKHLFCMKKTYTHNLDVRPSVKTKNVNITLPSSYVQPLVFIHHLSHSLFCHWVTCSTQKFQAQLLLSNTIMQFCSDKHLECMHMCKHLVCLYPNIVYYCCRQCDEIV